MTNRPPKQTRFSAVETPQTRSIVKYDYKREMKDLVGDVKYGLEETASFELLSYKPQPESSEVRKAIGGDL
jgi:hypothetical protein